MYIRPRAAVAGGGRLSGDCDWTPVARGLDVDLMRLVVRPIEARRHDRSMIDATKAAAVQIKTKHTACDVTSPRRHMRCS